ncbi:MAG: hypothetical protein OXN84_09995 [Albidovulum sp.]|nr:hypothetical protein [Albidovulum sp.]
MLAALSDIEEETETGEPPRAETANEAYVPSIQRVLEAVESCSSGFGKPAKLGGVVAALSIRAPNLAESTVNLELCAMRQFCGRMLERRELAKERGEHIVPFQVIPNNLNAPGWFVETSWPEFERLSARLKRAKFAVLFEIGLRLGKEAIERDKLRSGLGPNPGVVFELGNIKRGWPVADAKRKPKGNWENIGRQELEILLALLPGSNANFGIDTLGGGRFDANGMAKLLAWASWLTGMRAIEIFRCRIVVASSTLKVGRAEKFEILSDPINAFKNNFLVEFDNFGNRDPRDIGDSAREAAAKAGMPPMLLIESAKTVCSSPKIDNRLRMQILEGIASNDLAVLCLASRLRHQNIGSDRFSAIRSSCSRRIKCASLRAFPERLDPITLHYFRHAFADSARRLLTPPQVAALMGHTSLVTARGYGGKFVRRSKYAERTRWLPRHDPKQAKMLETAWNPTPEFGSDVAEPSPMPTMT